MKIEKDPSVISVALCVIATKRYKGFIESLLESVKKYFLTQHEISLFIFADSADYRGWLDLDEYNVCWTQIEHTPFPLPTLFRHRTLLKKEGELSSFDYVFHCDADARFVGEIGDEILGEGLTAIQHPSASGNIGDIPHKPFEIFWELNEKFIQHTFEHNPDSLAYIDPKERKKYFCGAIQGGLSEKYIEAMKVIAENIDKDLGQNILARYHDESHWNKYLVENPPSNILPFWYCFPESKNWPTRQVAWKTDVYVPEEEEIKMLSLNKALHGGYHLYRGKARK